MKKLLFVASILFFQQAFALELAKYPLELNSGEGVNVVIAPTLDKKQALVKVTGVNHKIDGVVFLTNLKPHGTNKAYKFTFDGTERSLVTVNEGYRCCSYTLYIPQGSEGTFLSKKDESSPAIVEDLKAQYEQQLADGTQERLASFDRNKHLKIQQQQLIKAQQNTLQQCGSAIETQLDWANVNDENLKKYAVGSFCAQVANEIAYMCEKDENFKHTATQFNRVECQFTDKLKLRKNAGVISFKTAPEAPNQRQFIEAYLLNL